MVRLGVSETKVEGVQKMVWGTHFWFYALFLSKPLECHQGSKEERMSAVPPYIMATPHNRDHLRGCHAGALDVP